MGIRRLTPAKKRRRREKNYAAVKPIYDRAATTIPKEYLTVHQESEPERVEKIKAKTQERRDRRNAKRLAQPKPRSRPDPVLGTGRRK